MSDGVNERLAVITPASPLLDQYARVHQLLGQCRAGDELARRITEETEAIIAADQGRLRALPRGDERDLLQQIATASVSLRAAQRILRSYAATLETRQR